MGNDTYTYTPPNDDWTLYNYDASLGAAVFFAVAIFLIGVWQAYTCFIQNRYLKFGITMAWGTIVFTAGFVVRAVAIQYPRNVELFISQYVLILAGPPILAGAEYFVLGRLFAYLPYHTPINPHRVLTSFLILGAAVESMTAAGAAQSAGTGRTEKQVSTGSALVKAALLLQVVVETVYLALLGLLIYRCKKHRYPSGQPGLPRNILFLSIVLAITSSMMIVRCIYRVVEYFVEASCPLDDPFCTSLSHTEVYLYVFEAANILLFLVLLAIPIFNPAKNLPSDTRVFLDYNDGVTMRQGPDWKDPRPWFVSAFDPFGFAGSAEPTVPQFWLKSDDYPMVGSHQGKGQDFHPLHSKESPRYQTAPSLEAR